MLPKNDPRITSIPMFRFYLIFVGGLTQIIVIGTSGVGVSKAVGNQVASVQVVLWMDGEGAGGAGGADLGGHAVERLGRVVHGWCTAFKQRFQRFPGVYICVTIDFKWFRWLAVGLWILAMSFEVQVVSLKNKETQLIY